MKEGIFRQLGAFTCRFMMIPASCPLLTAIRVRGPDLRFHLENSCTSC